MAINYISYFDRIPKIDYDINNSVIRPNYQTATNIFFRVRVLQEVLNNIFSYMTVEVTDSETPEIIAEKVYGDPAAAWIIIVANQIIDPQWDWPLDYDQFQKYIINKYGSLENAETTYHHYEMVVTRTLSPDNITTERRYDINAYDLINNILNVPFNYYYPKPEPFVIRTDTTLVTIDSILYTVDQDYDIYEKHDFNVEGIQPGSLAYTQYLNKYDIEGKTVIEVVKGNAVTNYDYENQINESKRLIKVIKKEYYTQIINEFNKLTNTRASYQRRVT